MSHHSTLVARFSVAIRHIELAKTAEKMSKRHSRRADSRLRAGDDCVASALAAEVWTDRMARHAEDAVAVLPAWACRPASMTFACLWHDC